MSTTVKAVLCSISHTTQKDKGPFYSGSKVFPEYRMFAFRGEMIENIWLFST